MPNKDYITVSKAMEMAKEAGFEITRATAIAWIRRHSLGRQPGGQWSDWYVHKTKWEDHLNGTDSTQQDG